MASKGFMDIGADVAIIMSVYINDKLPEVKLAVDSILDQSYPCDLFVIADGPIQSDIDVYFSQLIEERTCSKEGRFNFTRRAENKGLAESLNELIDTVLGNKVGYKYIGRMDADDISELNRVAMQVECLEKNTAIDVLGTGCREFSSSSSELFEKTLPKDNSILKRDIIKRCPFIHPSVMFRSAIFEDGVRYPIDTKLTEDYALWVELAARGYGFGNIPDFLIRYRFEDSVLKRRKGLAKANSEFLARLDAMEKLDCRTVRNVFFAFGIWGLRLLPTGVARIAYQILR
ncbi:UDP-Gal:alpha-D-GlcNAc-diphosphoundecaprenol beta-1,3-galactosyltransferase [Paraglaciecola mesophila]|uniref:UDP-Gal:alpha-D-GlcNAc-diphosphoundecaprenol beta-1,3-galactosyltransferase n=1 Tax=Paraglaciecola mesophila TaxID=197222 RepID=A0A857JQT1_9ALTE|nr:glycosyltransferase [Paraglaciecola mesophila]QHJ13441.1 UDP-Gal:alpha-D-GlcNAc-diphosphoundecaprenol beta-1,3-galactosyltransferase [Paraglaciecola mesophila]